MEAVLKRVYESRRTSLSLKIISHASVLICVLAYAVILVFSYISSPVSAVKVAAAALVPYVIVTVVRKFINAKRPYEIYGFYTAPQKNKTGQSFPSRHVFSCFVIATLAYSVSLWLSIALFVVGACLAMARVLLGIHFIRDVLAGAIIGVISGVIGIIIIL